MPYAIGNIIYGVPGNDDLIKIFNQSIPDIDDLFLDSKFEKCGIEFLYQGVAPWFFGIRLGQIDEIDNVNIKDLIENVLHLNQTFEIPENIKSQYQEKLLKLPDNLQKILPSPELLIVWSSS